MIEPREASYSLMVYDSNNLDPNLLPLGSSGDRINKPEVSSDELSDRSSSISSADSIRSVTGHVKAYFTDINDIVDRLYRLAAKLRNPVNRTLPSVRNFYRQSYRTAEGNECVPKSEERVWIRNQCEEIHSRRIEELVRQLRKDKNAATDDLDTSEQASYIKALIKRMGRSNAIRQQQFIFWREREHERRDNALRRATASRPVPDIRARHSLSLGPVLEDSKASISEKPSHTWQLPEVIVQTKPYLKVEDAVSMPSNWAPTTTPTDYEPGGKKVGWPEFPKEILGKGTFQCPYCFVICPASYRGKAHWRLVRSRFRGHLWLTESGRSHLIQDLLPYMCTYPDCSKGDRNVLLTSETWMVHESMHHRMRYYCMNHPSSTFSTREQYIEHVEDNHPEDRDVRLNDDEITSRASPLERPDHNCPFCLQTANNWEDMNKHIGFHLESLALLALPLTTGLEKDSSQGENSIDSRNREDGDADIRSTLESLEYASSFKHQDLEEDSDEMDVSEVEYQDSLANRIIMSFVKSTFDARGQDFLPESCIDELITFDAIRKELELDDLAKKLPKLNLPWQNKLVQWILKHARKAFAILVQCDRGPDITRQTLMRFRKGNFDDSQLPFDNPRLPTGVALPRPWEDLFDLSSWNVFRLYKFYDAQWGCIAPVFGPLTYNYDLSSECILPFIKAGIKLKEDAFSAVYRVKIHPAHQKHSNLEDVSHIV